MRYRIEIIWNEIIILVRERRNVPRIPKPPPRKYQEIKFQIHGTLGREISLNKPTRKAVIKRLDKEKHGKSANDESPLALKLQTETNLTYGAQ